MKVKKFSNLWQMGLIILGSILVLLYIVKLIFPEFIVGVAQIEPIIKFGNYVQTHEWAYYLFTFITSIFTYYFYCCACSRKKKVSKLDFSIICLTIIVLFVIQKFLPNYYYTCNVISLIALPTIICALDKRTDIKYLYSTGSVFTIHMLAQLLSLEIRGITAMITYPNIITLTILLVDTYIWLVLLYNYFTYKEV